MKLSRKDCAFEVKATDDAGQIEGYGSIFGNIDSHGDIVAPGAFKRSLEKRRAKGDAIPMLWQHDSRDVRGVWSDYAEDETGLKLTGSLVMDASTGPDTLALLRAKAVRGLSIGFVTVADEFDRKTGVRTLTEVDLWEVSLVTFPSNGDAMLTGVKSAEEIDAMSITEIEQFMRQAWDAPRSEAKRVISRLKALTAEREARRVEDATKRAELERLLRRLKS